MKLTLLTALSFLCLLLSALVCLSLAGDRLSSRLAWIGLGLLVATVAAALFFGWSAV